MSPPSTRLLLHLHCVTQLHHFSIVIKNPYNGNILDDWTLATPSALFPGYGLTPFNIAIKCVDGAHTGAANKGHGGGKTRALRLFFYADTKDPLPKMSMSTPKQYSEKGKPLCICSDIFFSGYAFFCGGGGGWIPPAWGLRKCEDL